MNEFEKKLIWNLNMCGTYAPRDYYFKLSEQFIRDNVNIFSFAYLSYGQHLSERFIIEFQDKVDWYFISIRQKLSKKFIIDFSGKLYLPYMSLCYFKVENEFSWKTFL